MNNCVLCIRKNITRKTPYFEDDLVWITDDLNKLGCKYRILAVLKRPTNDPFEFEIKHVETHLRGIADEVIGKYKYEIDRVCRAIPGHWHLQANSIEKG